MSDKTRPEHIYIQRKIDALMPGESLSVGFTLSPMFLPDEPYMKDIEYTRSDLVETELARLRSEIALRDRCIAWCLENSAARRQGGIVNMGTWNEKWLEVPAEFASILSGKADEAHVTRATGEFKEDILVQKARRDPRYAPYCLRCTAVVARMRVVEPFYWRCKCGAECDLRAEANRGKADSEVAK